MSAGNTVCYESDGKYHKQ